MELIHTNLYSSEDFTQIDLQSYLQSLIKNLQNTFSNSGHIGFMITCNDIKLDVEQAIACGQIINELTTNSFKHAFNEEEKGEIKIELLEENNLYVLVFSDTGLKTKEFYKKKPNINSLGLTIVHELAKYQLKGKLEIDNAHGVEYKIFFKKN
jgi:two-component sensor histidine kinase